MSSCRAPFISLLMSSSLSILAGQMAFAQTSSDELIVTATKLEKSIQELGLSVSIVDGEVLSQFDGAEELSQHVSGLQAAVANGSQISFQIRGIGAVDHLSLIHI